MGGIGYMKTHKRYVQALENNGTYIVNPLIDSMPRIKRGSYSIVYARLFNMEFHDFCKFLIDTFPSVRIHGKGQIYPKIFFMDKKEATTLANAINYLLNTHDVQIVDYK